MRAGPPSPPGAERLAGLRDSQRMSAPKTSGPARPVRGAPAPVAPSALRRFREPATGDARASPCRPLRRLNLNQMQLASARNHRCDPALIMARVANFLLYGSLYVQLYVVICPASTQRTLAVHLRR